MEAGLSTEAGLAAGAGATGWGAGAGACSTSGAELGLGVGVAVGEAVGVAPTLAPAPPTPLTSSRATLVIGGTEDSVVESTSGMAPAIEAALAATRPSPSAEAAPTASHPRAAPCGRGVPVGEAVMLPVSAAQPGPWVRVLSRRRPPCSADRYQVEVVSGRSSAVTMRSARSSSSCASSDPAAERARA